MAGIKSLVKDTAIYGLSSIVGRFIGYLLVPLYTARLSSTADYGIITNTYSWIALGIIFLTYGMETGFFRFVNKQDEDSAQVYSTVLGSLALTSTLFLFLILFFAKPIASFIHVENHPEYILLMGATLSIDAFSSICFSYLRYLKYPYRFALLKVISIFINVGLNLFFLVLVPFLSSKGISYFDALNNKDYYILYIFISNFIASLVILLLLSPYYFKIKWGINKSLLKKILIYSLPLLIVGIAGTINESGDKILYPYISNSLNAQSELGIYGANYKLAAVLVLFTQAFRFAFEPFIFAQSNEKDNKRSYAKIMTYFSAVGIVAWLGMVLFLDLVARVLIRDTAYYEGLRIVPIVLAGNLFLGMYYNLSTWYKLSDKTIYAAYFAGGGAFITLVLNLLFVNEYGYIACAWATFCSYAFMLVISYIYGQRYYPIPYEVKRIGLYASLAAIIAIINSFAISEIGNEWIAHTVRAFLLLIFIGFIYWIERKSF